MAIKFGNSIDLDDFQLLNFVVHNAAVAPASVNGGAMFWDTANNELKVFDTEGASWMKLVEGVTSSTNGGVVTWNGITGKYLGDSGINIDAVGPLSASATSIPTSSVIKGYVDTAVSGLSISAGRGLLMTGNTLSVDIDAVATETTILNADKLMFNKATDGLIYTITLADLASIIGGSGTGGEAFKTWVLTADSGYTWGTTSIVAVVGDTIDFVAGTGIELRTDPTLKALRITSTVTPGTGGIADPGTSVDREILTWNGITGDAVRVSTGASITAGGDMLVDGDVVAYASGAPTPPTTDTFKTWHLAADSGYTWGSADIVASGTDIIDFVAGANITLTTDPTSKALRITATGGGTGMVYPGAGIAVSTGAAWTTSIATANLSSLAGLTYAAGSFVKMTGANTFTLDTNTYSLSSHNHSGVYQPASSSLTSLAGLTYSSLAFVKLSGAGTFTLDTNSYVTASATVAFNNKTINATNNTITDTSIAVGDLLKSNGTKFVRFARGTSLQVLRVNVGGTDLEYATLNSLNTANFTVIQESGKLVVKYGASVIASFTSAGLVTAADDIVAFGTP